MIVAKTLKQKGLIKDALAFTGTGKNVAYHGTNESQVHTFSVQPIHQQDHGNAVQEMRAGRIEQPVIVEETHADLYQFP